MFRLTLLIISAYISNVKEKEAVLRINLTRFTFADIITY